MSFHRNTIALIISAALMLLSQPWLHGASAQSQPAPATAATADAPTLLTADELETLVARIALYPDDLVALVLSATVNPLQIVQAARFIDQAKNKPDLKPDPAWDGSIISLLNYPTVLTMMNDDLAWTQQLGEAVVDQQKDVLVAIQQLRDKAVADGTIKSDSKVIVETKNDNVIIRPAQKEVTYVPTYDPVILTSPTYIATEPIVYGDPYPSYYYPYAPYWTGFVTGAVWGAAVDWDNWHSWGGDDINININNINRGDFNFDRDNLKNLNFDRDQFKFDRDSIANNLRQNNANRLDLKNNRQSGRVSGGLLAPDRKSRAAISGATCSKASNKKLEARSPAKPRGKLQTAISDKRQQPTVRTLTRARLPISTAQARRVASSKILIVPARRRQAALTTVRGSRARLAITVLAVTRASHPNGVISAATSAAAHESGTAGAVRGCHTVEEEGGRAVAAAEADGVDVNRANGLSF